MRRSTSSGAGWKSAQVRKSLIESRPLAAIRRVEALVPMGRLGTMDELAHMALPFVDGTSRFTTGQFVGFAGGWV